MAITARTALDQVRQGAIQSASWRLPVLIFAATSMLGVALKPLLDGEVSSGLIFVLGITLVGATSGLVPAVISSILASAVFNFFLADPVLTFRLSSGEDLAPPFIFTACAIVSGLLSGQLRDRTSQLSRTNLQLESLLETSRNLQTAPDIQGIEDALASTISERLGFGVSLYGLRNGEAHPLASSGDRADRLGLADAAIQGAPAVHGASNAAYRLEGSRSCVGALVIESLDGIPLDEAFLTALASLLGLALERALLASMIAEKEASERTEALKSALLSSVSHDFRTPLTAISASASSLIEFRNRLDEATSIELLKGIVEECDRLNSLTANVLELSRLQSGEDGITGQVLSINDVVRSVVGRLQARASDRDIRITATQADILVSADAALFELVLVNVIQNALLYSDPETSVLVQSGCDRDDCVITVTDQGCGIPRNEQSRVFDRFYRVKRSEPSPPGSGLGLAIAKGFVEAFRGSIELRSPVLAGKGTSVSIRLPAVHEDSP